MNADEVGMMFAEISQIDPRVRVQPDKRMLQSWAQVLDDVPLAAAQEAVREYYRSERYAHTHDTISTADIYGHYQRRMREWREQQHNRELEQQRAAIAAAPQPVGALAAKFARWQANKRGQDADAAAAEAQRRHEVLMVACPHCKARSGVGCLRPSGKALRAPHPARISAADSSAPLVNEMA